MRRVCLLLLCLLLLLPPASFGATAEEANDTNARAEGLIESILTYKTAAADASDVQGWIDGELSAAAGVSAEWYILALAQSGAYDFSSYEAALLQRLREGVSAPATTRQKYALCLSAIGSTSGYISSILADSIGKQGILSWVWGLHLLNNGYRTEGYTVDSVIDMLLSLQCTDGGWSLTGVSGDADVTAMVLSALAPHAADVSEVSDAVTRALRFLSAAQLEQGDFRAYGVANAESAAQVLIALSALGVDCRQDARFIKNGSTLLDVLERYRLPDGGFCHVAGGEVSESATAQALLAAVAYRRMLEGDTSLYLVDLADPEGVEPPVSAETETEDVDGRGDSATETESPRIGYKLWVSLGIVVLGGLICLILVLCGRRHVKNFLCVAVAVAICVTLVSVTDLQSPEDYYHGERETREGAIGSVTVSIRCDTVAGREEHIPQDGTILPETEMELVEGDTVYSILVELSRRYRIPIENDGNRQQVYITGIHYLYEGDFGDLSGWVFRVNGVQTSVGAGAYVLRDGDVIEWLYTCRLGEDLP